VFLCPSTLNRVTEEIHLRDNSRRGSSDESGGHSYEIRWWVTHIGVRYPDGSSFPQDPTNQFPWGIPKRISMFKQHARVSFLTDADDADEGDINNWPDKTDNHKDKGWNTAYLDGHVEWTETGRPIFEAFMGGYYHGQPDGGLMAKYGLSFNGSEFKWLW
jgi:prepilin-type processing-associated H-X9-DG protein